MDVGSRSPLVECFRRGEVPRDVRLLAARGAVAPNPVDQLTLLALLADDADEDVAARARETLDGLSRPALAGFLARPDVPDDLRAWLTARTGLVEVVPPGGAGAALPDSDDEPLPEVTLVDDGDVPVAAVPDESGSTRPVPLSSMPVIDRIKLAMRGTREQRGVLVRDANRLVAAAVLSSPKLTETEIESFARMANVSDEVLRTIGVNRQWTKNYPVVAALVRNPKTPPAISLPLVSRLTPRDVKALAVDRNVPEGLRLSARKLLATTEARRK